MSTFTILVDNSADLPLDYVKEHDIKRISLAYHLNDVTHYDDDGLWKDVTAEEYYKALADGGTSGTVLVNPEAFAAFFTKCAERGEEVLAICLSNGLSGTAPNAIMARDEVKEKYPKCRIRIVDTLSAASGTTIIAAMAVNKRAEGASLDETADYLKNRVQNCYTLFTVDDLNFLHRGGRLSKLSAVAGSIIGVKPLLNVSSVGIINLREKARGRKGAIEALANQVRRSMNPGSKVKVLAVSHCNCKEDAEKLIEKIKELIEVEEVLLEVMGPVIGSHIGPGGIAISIDADLTRDEYDAKFYPAK